MSGEIKLLRAILAQALTDVRAGDREAAAWLVRPENELRDLVLNYTSLTQAHLDAFVGRTICDEKQYHESVF